MATFSRQYGFCRWNLKLVFQCSISLWGKKDGSTCNSWWVPCPWEVLVLTSSAFWAAHKRKSGEMDFMQGPWTSSFYRWAPVHLNMDNPNSRTTRSPVEITLLSLQFLFCTLHMKLSYLKEFYLALLFRIKRKEFVFTSSSSCQASQWCSPLQDSVAPAYFPSKFTAMCALWPSVSMTAKLELLFSWPSQWRIPADKCAEEATITCPWETCWLPDCNLYIPRNYNHQLIACFNTPPEATV